MLIVCNWFCYDVLCVYLTYFDTLHAPSFVPAHPHWLVLFLVSFPPTCISSAYLPPMGSWRLRACVPKPTAGLLTGTWTPHWYPGPWKYLTVSYQPLTAHVPSKEERDLWCSWNIEGAPTMWGLSSNHNHGAFKRAALVACLDMFHFTQPFLSSYCFL